MKDSLENKDSLIENRIGSLICIYAEKGVSVDPSAFNAALAGQGLAEHAKDVCKPHTALVRAVGNSKKGIQDDGVSSGWMRIGEDENGVLAFGLLRKKSNNQKKDIETEVVTVACVEKSGNYGVYFLDKSTLTSEEERAKDAVVERYQKERGYLTIGDLRKVVNDVAESQGFRVGSSSTFVALKGGDEEILRLKPALELGNMKIVATEIFNENAVRFGEEAQESFLEQAANLLQVSQSRLAMAEAALNGERKATMKDLRVAQSTLEECESLLEKAELFKQALSFSTEDVEKAIGNAKATILQCLNVCMQVG